MFVRKSLIDSTDYWAAITVAFIILMILVLGGRSTFDSLVVAAEERTDFYLSLSGEGIENKDIANTADIVRRVYDNPEEFNFGLMQGGDFHEAIYHWETVKNCLEGKEFPVVKIPQWKIFYFVAAILMYLVMAVTASVLYIKDSRKESRRNREKLDLCTFPWKQKSFLFLLPFFLPYLLITQPILVVRWGWWCKRSSRRGE